MDKRAAKSGPFALPFGLKKGGRGPHPKTTAPFTGKTLEGELYRSLFKIPFKASSASEVIPWCHQSLPIQ